MHKKEIRWQQRFEMFEKAYLELAEAMQKDNYSKLERAGVIQTFEFTFELAWKTLKDYLEAKGYVESFPRDTIKKAFEVQLIEDGHTWMEALKQRNLAAHTYDEAHSLALVKAIKENFFKVLKQLYLKLQSLR
jgi:nucleotidyltransferase substrate binding protein (TIGR01987 family)